MSLSRHSEPRCGDYSSGGLSAEPALSRLGQRKLVSQCLGCLFSASVAVVRMASATSTCGQPRRVVAVPPRRAGLGASVLPQSCQDLVEVVADAGRPLRAAQIAAAAGLSTDQARVAGLRSQCAGRGRPGQPLLCLRELLRSCWRWPSQLPSATWTRRTPRCPLTRWYPVRPRRVCSGPQDPWGLQF